MGNSEKLNNMEMRWVLCEDRLPEHDCQCLILMKEPYSFFELCSYLNKKKKFRYWDDYNDCENYYKTSEVKAWVELKIF